MAFVSPFCEWPEGCDKFKMNTNVPYCTSHQDMVHREKRELSKPMKEKTEIKKQSDQRKKEHTKYLIEARKWLVGKHCKICIDKGKGEVKATEVHHKEGRDNDKLLDKSKWLPICTEHHAYITINSAWAIKHGYSILRSTNSNQLSNGS